MAADREAAPVAALTHRMSLRTPPPPTVPIEPTPTQVDAGVIEDARHRQLQHRRAGVSAAALVVAAAVGSLLAFGGAGGHGGSGGNRGNGGTGPAAPGHGNGSGSHQANTSFVSDNVSTALRDHFALLRTTPSVNLATASALVRDVVKRNFVFGDRGNAELGINPKQMRVRKLAPSVYLMVTPGARGLCTELVYTAHAPVGTGLLRHGEGGCGPTQGYLSRGPLNQQGDTNGKPTYTLSGIVADGNRVVSVRPYSGGTRKIPVRDNTVYAVFHRRPRSYTYKTAYGKIITVPWYGR